MSGRVQRNILANFGGKAWAAALPVILIPFYIRFLGIESYGLIGFYASLQAIVSLLDMGLGVTMSRESARLSAVQDDSRVLRSFIRTLETIYWALGGVVALGVFLAAPWLAREWLEASSLSPETMERSIRAMGVALGVQFPLTLYSGGMLGLQRQVALNLATATLATVRGVGAFVVLAYVSRTIFAFFVWQIAAAALTTCVVGYLLWKSVAGHPQSPTFDRSHLLRVWRFSLGVSGTSLAAVLLTQTDKLVLSRLVSLEMLGYYTLATSLSLGLYTITSSVFSAVFPRFSELISRGDDVEMVRLYHRSAQVMAVMVLPVAATLAALSDRVLWAWTGDAQIVEFAAPLLTLLVIGTALNSMVHVPYALQLASGWTSLALYQNVIAACALVPMIYLSTVRYGAIGAATVWVILNAGYVLIGIGVMHRRLIPTEKGRWYLQAVLLPMSASAGAAILMRYLLPDVTSRPGALSLLAVALLITFCAAALATPVTRKWAASAAAGGTSAARARSSSV